MTVHSQPSALTPTCAIVHTHDDFYVVMKPSGLGMHQEGEQPSLVTLLAEQLQEPLWPVHRLDTDTSGLLILARNKGAAAYFGDLFETQQVEKYYLAISDRKPKKKQGLISGDMAKSRNGSWKLTSTQHNPAVTQFFSTSLAEPISPSAASYRLFLLKPRTGRTHQLRVALKSLGSAIIGDRRYTGSHASCMHLHAYGLCFQYHDVWVRIFTPPRHSDLWQRANERLAALNWQSPEWLEWPKVADNAKA